MAEIMTEIMAKGSKTRTRTSGNEITHHQQETDSPIIPVQQIERLQALKPGAVDWVLQQTEIEANHRRTEEHRVNSFIFTEGILGQICALIIGLAGIGGGAFVALNGQPWAGALIASFAITGLAIVFIREHKKE